MIQGYNYELWDGKKVVGHYYSIHKICGLYLCISTVSELKREYGKRYETITVPIAYRLVMDNGIDYTMRRVLDVRKKSKRQRALIK